MSLVSVRIDEAWLDRVFGLADEEVSLVFKEALEESPGKILQRLARREVEDETSAVVVVEYLIDLGESVDAYFELLRVAGDKSDTCLTLILEEVISALSDEDAEDAKDLEDLVIDEGDDLDADEPRVKEITECCGVLAFDDGEDNLMCPECGSFVVNQALGDWGCPNCGSGEIDGTGHCQNCTTFIGPSIATFR
jgi:predicted RNA-binding Zn-ribbon protein involved in translation (DUF1610 family)